jgi:hypothetical protein
LRGNVDQDIFSKDHTLEGKCGSEYLFKNTSGFNRPHAPSRGNVDQDIVST